MGGGGNPSVKIVHKGGTVKRERKEKKRAIAPGFQRKMTAMKILNEKGERR